MATTASPSPQAEEESVVRHMGGEGKATKKASCAEENAVERMHSGPAAIPSAATQKRGTVLDLVSEGLSQLAKLVTTKTNGRWSPAPAAPPPEPPEPSGQPVPSKAQTAGLHAQLGDMVANICKRLPPAATATSKRRQRHFAEEGYRCDVCDERFVSRSQLFKHLRDQQHSTMRPSASSGLIRYILDGNVDAAAALVASQTPQGWTSLKAADVVMAAIDSGETAVQLAAIMYVLSKGRRSSAAAHPDRWLELIVALIEAGADPFTRPYIKTACLDRFGRRNPEMRQLRQWGAGHHFRGGAAELAWATADSALCSIFLGRASATMLAKISTFRFIPCPHLDCVHGAAVSGGFGGGGDLHAVGAGAAEPVACCKCARVFCPGCRRGADVHMTKGGRWGTCEEALCTELLRQHHLCQDDIAAFQSIHTFDTASQPHRRMIQRMAEIQVDDQASVATRGAAADALAKFAPDRVAKCGVCDDAFGEVLPVVGCKHGMLRVQKAVCSHRFCRDCYTSWIASNLEERKTCIRCPEPGCRVTLYADDVKRIAPTSLHQLYTRLVTADYRTRLLEAMKEEGGNWAAKDPQTRPCPACRVVVHRSSGCDDFICNCGHRFHFTSAKWPTIAELEAEIESQGVGTGARRPGTGAVQLQG